MPTTAVDTDTVVEQRPALLGGPDTLMIGRVIWDEFFANRDWPVASALAIAALFLLVIPITMFQRLRSRQEGA